MVRRTTTDRSQRSRILGLLLSARGSEVPLTRILDLRISQFGARLSEIRGLGFRIVNRIEITPDGEKRSWYRLVSGPSTPTAAPQPESEPPEQSKLFGDISPDRSYQE